MIAWNMCVVKKIVNVYKIHVHEPGNPSKEPHVEEYRDTTSSSA